MNCDNLGAMTQVAPTFKQSARIQDRDSERVKQGDAAEGTQAAAFVGKPTAPIYGQGDQKGQGEGRRRDEAIQYVRDANTGDLKVLARRVSKSSTQKANQSPGSSPLKFFGANASPAIFEKETALHQNRKDYLATPFHPDAKFSPLSGARITFGDDDLPFNSAVPFDARKTTLPEGEHNQLQTGMVEARLNRGPVAWGIRHGSIRV